MQGTKQGEWTTLFKLLELPDDFHRWFLKAVSWVKVTGYITFFWLVGDDVTGGILGISIINLIVPTSLGSTCLWSPYSPKIEVSVFA